MELPRIWDEIGLGRESGTGQVSTYLVSLVSLAKPKPFKVNGRSLSLTFMSHLLFSLTHQP